MKKEWLVKTLALVIVVLFVSVAFQPVLAEDTISSMKKSDTKELLETIKDLANNKEIQDIIQKSEIKGSPIRFQQLLGRLQKEIIGSIEKNDELNGRLKQLQDLPCDCENEYTSLWHFPIVCSALLLFGSFLTVLLYKLPESNGFYDFMIWLIAMVFFLGFAFNCRWWYFPPTPPTFY